MNSPLTVCTILSPNNSGPRKVPIDRITIHCVVGQCTAEALGHLFEDPARYASSNYGVDKNGRVGCYVPEDCVSWCSSSGPNDNRAVTIETASDNHYPYAVTDAALTGLLDLCTDICRRNGKKRLVWLGDKDKTLTYQPAPDEMIMTVHRWFANKSCPGQFLMERQGWIAETVTKRLQQEDSMRYNTIEDCPEWAKDTITKLVLAGVVQGRENGKLDLSDDMLRLLVMLDRANVFKEVCNDG